MGSLAILAGRVLGAAAVTGPQPPTTRAKGKVPYDVWGHEEELIRLTPMYSPLPLLPSTLAQERPLKRSFMPTLFGTSKFRVFK